MLLIGILCSMLADKLKIPNVLLLILIGFLLSRLSFQGEKLINFSPMFLSSLGILALVMIVFDGTSNFKWRDIDSFSVRILKLVISFIFLNVIFLTLATMLIFPFNARSLLLEVCLALIFSFINSGTDPATVIIIVKDHGREKIPKLLQIESIMNTPFMVLFPFIIIELMESIKLDFILPTLLEQVQPLIQQFVTGIGSGVLVGIIFFKVMRKRYSEKFSPLALITAALLTYTLAENLGGNGVLAVTTLGIFFGNVMVAQKDHLMEFSTLFASALEIMVFVFIGLIVEIPFTISFFIRSILLFAVYLLVRYASIHITFRSDFSFREKLYMTFNVSKGIAVATLVFAITTLYQDETSVLFNMHGITSLLNLTLIFMVYSITLSTIVVRYTDYFLKPNCRKAD
ncbi:MAG: cation:proton antiporter [Candidatus Woesearchaeota archaeon]